jgi:hypothetical protein
MLLEDELKKLVSDHVFGLKESRAAFGITEDLPQRRARRTN